MQPQEAELHELVDERVGAVGESLPIGEEREQHADREALSIEDGAPRHIDDDHRLQAGHHALDEPLRDGEAADGDAGIGRLGMQVAPATFTHRLTAEKLQRHRRPHALHEMRLLLGLREDLLLHPLLHARKQRQVERPC